MAQKTKQIHSQIKDVRLRHGLSFKLVLYVSLLVFVSCAVLMVTSTLKFRTIGERMKEIRVDTVMNGYKLQIKSEVQTGISIIQNYYDKYKNGEMTEKEAQEAAKDTLRQFRYGDQKDGYLWIDSTDYTLVMHPILPDQEGKNRYDLEDKKGTKIIQTMFKSIESGDGYSTFWFTKSDGKTVAEKTAYSEKFDKWNWVVTTGVYTEDIQEVLNDTQITDIFKSAEAFLGGESIILIAGSILIAFACIRVVVNTLNKVKVDLNNIADGDLTLEVDDHILKRKDELGVMGSTMQSMGDSLKEMVKTVKSSAGSVNKSSVELKSTADTTLSATNEISKAIEEIASGATKQIDSVQNIANDIENINKNIESVNKSVEDITECSGKVAESSSFMQQKVNFMSDGSLKMSDSISEISEKIQSTSKVIHSVEGIIEVIEDIASQTKLLSLNASIEAARAGESGKGFAVVATTIRELSESTSTQLEEVKKIIDRLVADFNQCINAINDVIKNNDAQKGEIGSVITSFKELEDNINETNERIHAIEKAINDTAIQTQSVTEQADSLTGVVETSAASTQEVNASIEELNALMNEVLSHSQNMHSESVHLNDNLKHFKVE